MIELLLPMDAIPCPRPRMTRQGRVYYPAKYNHWKKAARDHLQGALFALHISSPIKYPVRVVVDILITRPRHTKLKHPKPDIDNLLKSILDSCTRAGLWDDDDQVVDIEATKKWAPKGTSGSTVIQVTKAA